MLKSATAQKYIQSKSFSIIKGDLIYASQNAKELEWAQEVGIGINPYNIDENGVLLSSDTNLMLMDEATGTLVIPEMVTAIGEGTFGVVKGLRKVVIPPTVKEIQQNAFRRCTSLEEVVFETKIENGLEVGTKKLGMAAFGECTNLQSIELPNTIVNIESSVFAQDIKLTHIVLPKNITVVNSSTFRNCRSLQTITIPSNVNYIANEVFADCWNLTSINLPEKLETIDTSCFSGCYKLQNIILERREQQFYI